MRRAARVATVPSAVGPRDRTGPAYLTPPGFRRLLPHDFRKRRCRKARLRRVVLGTRDREKVTLFDTPNKFLREMT